MTVPGVSVITACTFIAAAGDIRRFRSARRLVGYLGLDPRVRRGAQVAPSRPPASSPASSGRCSAASRTRT
jgi:transposase